MKQEIQRQLDIIAARTIDLVSREELARKLEKALAENRPLRVKYGADPSAPDIHLGHVVGLNKLREFQDLGHIVVFIIGDFTGMIGDPSGRSETRKPLSRAEIEANAKTYQEQVFKVLNPARTETRLNSEWCSPLSFPDVLKLTAQFTVSQMLAREDFAMRMKHNHPISLVEFMYPIIQAYDSVRIEADVEIGGTDQIFNLLVGRDLQRASGQDPQVVLTLPLIEGLDGVKKMSKSLGNYIGINEAANDMFGKTMSISDELMWRYYSLVLCAPEAELEGLRAACDSGARSPRDVKDELARRIVERFHDAETARTASEEFKRVFARHEAPSDIPAVSIPAGERHDGRLWIVALIVKAGLAPSNGAARRLIQQGAVKLGESRITDVEAELDVPDGTVLQVGKRGFARIQS
ncbi:MAG: tyrosine--tRNA ligase [Kiritimatiellae bacterium]|nr:tyrosine--tRNA ligase [Kiritimatiellia bacterium]